MFEGAESVWLIRVKAIINFPERGVVSLERLI
jgi:hypothetical protein